MIITPGNENNFFTGYAIEKEDREAIYREAVPAEYLMTGELPVRVDPRQTELYKSGNWLPTEDQLAIGACQGNALTENLEFCHAIHTGKVKAYSRMYAYIGSQMEDGIRTDSGSTLSGGTRLAKKGCASEAKAPYPSRYPGWSYITPEMRADAVDKLESSTTIRSSSQMKQYLGSGIGIVQIGVSWGRSFNPNSLGCITGFAPGGGGHSVVYCGYVPDEDVGASSGAGYWFIMKNSWGTRWGIRGLAFVSPASVDAQLRHQWSVFLGRSDLATPTPRIIHTDFIKDGNSIN